MLNKDKIAQSYNKAKSERDSFIGMLTDCYRYCIPSRNGFVTQGVGQRKDLPIYNTGPVQAVKNFASTILSLSTPNGVKFFDIKAKDYLVSAKDSQEDRDAAEQEFNKAVSPISDTLFEYIANSSFYIAYHESLIDLAVGTGGILCTYSGDDSDPLRFTSLNMAKVSFSESSNGLVNNIYQDIENMNIELAKSTYPEANFPSNQETISFILACVYDEGKKIYHYMILDSGNYEVWMDIEYDYNPFVIFRWSKLSGESWGRGIISDNLGSIKSANQMKADILTASQRVIAPPTMVHQNSIVNPSNIDFSPNSIITVKPIQGVSNPITTLPFSGNLPIGMQMVDAFNQELNSELFNEPLGSVGQGSQTATEITQRMQIFANKLGAPYSRLQRECLSRIIDASISILTKRGLLPQLPNKVKISFKSPITHLQKTTDFSKTMQSIQTIMQIAGQNAQQALAFACDIPKLTAYIPDALGADLSLFRTAQEVKDMMSEMQKQSIQQRENQIMAQGANQALGSNAVDTGVPGVKQL